MPGLLRGIARTAAIAGTATAVSNGVSKRQVGRWNKKAQADQADAPVDQNPQDNAAAEPASDTDEQLAQLERLGKLHDSGVLTDEEFTAKKQQILGL